MKKVHIIIAVITATLLTAVINTYWGYHLSMNSHLRKDVEVRLHEVVVPNITSFDLQMKEQVNKVKTMADFLGEYGILDDENTLALLKSAVKNNGLLRCAIAFPDGSFITHDGKNEGNVKDDPFFKAVMKGEFFITDPQPAVVDQSKTVVLFCSPIVRDGKIIGSIIYSYLCDNIDAIFNLDFLNDEGKMFVISKQGAPLIGAQSFGDDSENVLDYLRDKCTHLYHQAAECMIIDGYSGSCTLSIEELGSPLLVSYDKLSYNDWYMLSMVTETAAGETLIIVSKDQLNLGITILLYAFIYLAAMIIFRMKTSNNIDKKTGLYTLNGFKKLTKKIISKADNFNFVFLKLDVKNFKLINRIYNYAEGDRVIQNIAEAFRYVLAQKNPPVARVGTDDFLFFLPYRGRGDLDKKRDIFITQFRELMGSHFTTAVEFPTGQYLLTEKDLPKPDIEEILEKVNFAHRAAKQRNLDIIVDYEENLEKEALLEKSIIDQMSDALINGEFCLFLQPKYEIQTETVCGAESLVRWIVNGRFYLPPVSFIPVLERNGFIVKLDMFMFEKTVKKIRSLIDGGKTPFPISVNFSICHLANENFVFDLCHIADTYQVPHGLLEIELTESAVFEHVDRIRELISRLHAEGFTLAMDDFGSGYSSLALLKDLDVDVLKLDKAFFDLDSDENRSRIVISNIINLAKELGIRIVAEGVEVKAQVDMLRDLECDMIQGYYYSRPLPEDNYSQ